MIREACYKITENCPCNCLFCDSKEKYEKIFNKTNIGFEDWKLITDKLIKEGLEVVVLSGGEPLLQEDITFKLIKYLQNKDIYVVLNTSGILFKNNKLLEKVKDNYPDLLVFSMDSAYPEQHNFNRKKEGVFEQVVASIKDLKSSGDYPIAIRTVITRENYRQLPKIILDFNELGVDCIKLTNIEDDEEGKFRLELSDLENFDNIVRKEIINSLEKCKYSDSHYKIENINKIKNLFSRKNGISYEELSKGHFSPDLIGNVECDLYQHFFSIECNGVVLPCCEAEHHYSPKLGNLVEMTVDEMMNSQKFEDFKSNRQEYCITCTQRHNLQLNFNETGTKVNRR